MFLSPILLTSGWSWAASGGSPVTVLTEEQSNALRLLYQNKSPVSNDFSPSRVMVTTPAESYSTLSPRHKPGLGRTAGSGRCSSVPCLPLPNSLVALSDSEAKARREDTRGKGSVQHGGHRRNEFSLDCEMHIGGYVSPGHFWRCPNNDPEL